MTTALRRPPEAQRVLKEDEFINHSKSKVSLLKEVFRIKIDQPRILFEV
jgi:hypothetical protein